MWPGRSEAQDRPDLLLHREEGLPRIRVHDDTDLRRARDIFRERRRKALGLAVEEELSQLAVGLALGTRKLAQASEIGGLEPHAVAARFPKKRSLGNREVGPRASRSARAIPLLAPGLPGAFPRPPARLVSVGRQIHALAGGR